MKEILLSKNGKYKGKFTTLVDDADFEWLNKYSWNVLIGKHSNYAYRIENGKLILMHRFIMDTPKGLEVDHLDTNGLNNQKYNLKNCTSKENNNNPLSRKHLSEAVIKRFTKKEERLKMSESHDGVSDPKIWHKIRIEYEKNGKSTYELAKEYNVHNSTIKKYIINAGGKIRTISEAMIIYHNYLMK